MSQARVFFTVSAHCFRKFGGSLYISHVNDKFVPQLIYGVPKQEYPVSSLTKKGNKRSTVRMDRMSISINFQQRQNSSTLQTSNRVYSA